MKKIYFISLLFSLIFIFLGYSFFVPNEYTFLCDGLSKKSEYSLEDKKTLLRKDNFLDNERLKEVVKIKKYFFGQFYTLNNYSKENCHYDKDDDVIFCYRNATEDLIEFDTIKLTLEKKTSRTSSLSFDVFRYNGTCNLKEKLL